MGSSQGSPSSNLYATALEAGTNCDLILADPTAPECLPAGAASAICSMVGGLSVSPLSTAPYVEDCFAGFKNEGKDASSCYCRNLVEYCNYNVVPWCANTSNPDFYITQIVNEWVLFGDFAYGWVTDIREKCWPLGPGQPWHGFETFPLVERFSYFAPVACTYNP